MEKLNTQLSVSGRFLGGALFTPKQPKEAHKSPEYTANIALDDGFEAKVRAVVANAIKNEFGDKVPASLQDWGVRKGDDPEYASFGKWYINPKSKSVDGKGNVKPRPKTVVKRDGVLHEVQQADGIIYPGCYVAASITAYAYPGDSKQGIKPGVSINLRAVMFLKDGEKLGNSFSENEFDEFESAGSPVADEFGFN